MQRPQHARFMSVDPNAAIVPQYSPVDVPTPLSAVNPYQHAYYTPSTGAPTTSLADAQFAPIPAPTNRRRVSESSANHSRPGNGLHQRTMSEMRPRRLYDAPITYGTNDSPPPPPKRSKRRKSVSVAAMTPAASKRDSLLDYGSAGHIFLSFSGHNTLKLKHVPRALIDAQVLQPIKSIWRDGIASSIRKGVDWVIELRGSPWTCKGEQGFQARRVVTALFQILGDASYNYVSAVAPEGLSGSPTLIFAATPSFYPSHFFCLAFSSDRRQLFILDAPDVLTEAIVATVRSNFKNSTPGKWMQRGVYGIELTDHKIQRQDLPHQLANILHAIGISGYRLDASVSMGREGFLGISGRREVWLFRSYSPMPGVMYT